MAISLSQAEIQGIASVLGRQAGGQVLRKLNSWGTPTDPIALAVLYLTGREPAPVGGLNLTDAQHNAVGDLLRRSVDGFGLVGPVNGPGNPPAWTATDVAGARAVMQWKGPQ